MSAIRITRKPELVALRKDGTAVQSGETVTSFRGQEWTFVCPTRAQSFSEGKSGKVVVRDEFDRQREFYETVFDLTVIEKKEEGK